jgi:hypothetical protein
MNMRLLENRRGNIGSTLKFSRLAYHSQIIKHIKKSPARMKNKIIAAEFQVKCTPPSSSAATKKIEALSSAKAPKGSALYKSLESKDKTECRFSGGGSQC